MPEPLPSPGSPISINQIRNYYNTSSGSLRFLSDLAGFSTPDSMSEFYSGGGGLIMFYISPPTYDPSEICNNNPACCTQVWHNGSNPLPDIGNIVYNDSGGTDPLLPFKGQVFFGNDVNECGRAYSWLKISESENGEVVNNGGCL